jgi:restriction system protein
MRKNKTELTTEAGQLQVKVSARGSVSYSIEVSHQGLHKHRLIRGPDAQVLQAKVRLQAASWDELWAKRVALGQQETIAYLAKEQAAKRTTEAQRYLQSLREVLSSSLSDSKAVDWNALKDQTPFPGPEPKAPSQPLPPVPGRVPLAPSRSDFRYQLTGRLTLLDKLIASRRLAKEAAAEQLFEQDIREWDAERDRILADDAAKLHAYNKQLADLETAHAKTVKAWEAEREEFLSKQREQHEAIAAFRARYESREAEAVSEYCDMVLASSEYPDFLPKEFDLGFNPDTGVFAVNYRLPAPSAIPTLSEVKYIQSGDRFSEKYLSETNAAKLYDDLIYQIALRTLNEVLEADQAAALTGVVFNGFVTDVDKGTGNEATACIISVQASREALQGINLLKVDPKACFRQLRGVGSSKLHSVTPVAPIINLRKDDERFIQSYGVAERLDEGFNLAAMDWEDFEHLIRGFLGRSSPLQAERCGLLKPVEMVALMRSRSIPIQYGAEKSLFRRSVMRTRSACRPYGISTARL